MKLIHKNFKDEPAKGKWVITIGNFDGYHLGHQTLVHQVLEDKKRLKIRGGVLTFDPHPKKLLQPGNPFRHIYDDKTKWELLQKAGLDAGFIIPFTKKFAAQSPMEFVEGLFRVLDLKKIIVGYDFNFGKAREGSAAFMKEEAARRDIDFVQMESVKSEGITISSTMIRRLLFEGDFQVVDRFLGRPWSINGIVKRGKQLGRTIGFPTLNLEPELFLPVKRGVYACEIELNGKSHQGVCNIGFRPTLGDQLYKVEVHLFDFEAEAYGENIKVYPKQFIREEKKFENLDALKAGILNDAKEARHFFQ